MIKHPYALNLFLIAVAAINFNRPVASQPAYSAFTSDGDLKTAVDTYCSNGGEVDPTYG